MSVGTKRHLNICLVRCLGRHTARLAVAAGCCLGAQLRLSTVVATFSFTKEFELLTAWWLGYKSRHCRERNQKQQGYCDLAPEVIRHNSAISCWPKQSHGLPRFKGVNKQIPSLECSVGKLLPSPVESFISYAIITDFLSCLRLKSFNYYFCSEMLKAI